MKRLLLIFSLLFVFNCALGQNKVEQVKTCDGKIYYKRNGTTIVSAESEKVLEASKKSSQPDLSEEEKALKTYGIYIVTTDKEIKDILQSAFTPELAKKYKDQKIFISIRSDNTGVITAMTFMVRESQSMWSIDPNVLSKLEDMFKKNVKMSVPINRGMFNYVIPIEISRIYSTDTALPPSAYTARN